MGAWGPGIFQNDTTADIWTTFKQLYNKGLTSKEVRLILEEEYKHQRYKEYYSEIWTGVAYGQWMYGDIEKYTLKKLENATQLKWLTLWADDKKLLQKRIKAITQFIEKIQTPRPEPVGRKKETEKPLIYKKGDVIALKFDAIHHLAGLVVNRDDNPNSLGYTIILTDLFFTEKPTEKEILNANILYLDIGGEYRYHRGFYRASFTAKNMARKAKLTIKIGEISITEYLSLGAGLGVGDWNKIATLYFEQVDFLKNNNTNRPFTVTVNDLIHPKKDLQDKLIQLDKRQFQEQLEWRQENAI
jgi:hypothetical protein